MNDNLQEYENPIEYDKENDVHTADIPLIASWAKKVTGPIIDLACGTGRVTIPLAQAGHQMVGIDIHAGMLARAREKAAHANVDIPFYEQDCTALQLEGMEQSALVYMVGNSFQHFLTNEAQDALLAGVSRLLKEGGLFIFDTRFPSAEELLEEEHEAYWRSYEDEQGQVIDVFTSATYDPVSQVQKNVTVRRRKKDNTVVNQSKIDLRYVYPQEMLRLFSAHQFKVVASYQDWQGHPLREDAQDMVYVVQKETGM
ncbi:class I SAM-dependent methyltransferase [Bacillus sp. FSL W7-1360]